MKPARVDWLISMVLLLAALIAYTGTLAPTLLEGDKALYQYTPHVLGVTYPTGFPTYLLLAKGWLMLFPLGQIAWRMNLFSAVCAGLTPPILYGVARRLWNNRLAALSGVLVFATIPTYWLWATQAKTYTLNILLYCIVLWLALQGAGERGSRGAGERRSVYRGEESFRFRVKSKIQNPKSKIDRWLALHRYKLGAFVLGLQVGVHNTTILLIPGILWLFWLDFKANQSKIQNPKSKIGYGLFFLIPAASYLYIPFRAEWLLAHYGREMAIARGLVADFYQSGLKGWVTYFTAAEFTGGIATNWGQVPGEFFSRYVPFLEDDLTQIGIALGVIGAVTLLWQRPRYFWPLFLLYLAPIPFMLTYGQGEQRAFLLTSYLIFSLFSGGVFPLIETLIRKLQQLVSPPSPSSRPRFAYLPRLISRGIFAVIIFVWPYKQALHNYDWLSDKWGTESYDYWDDILNHPLERGAGIMADWGDLTSLWYMQHGENRRPDLWGLYPPQEQKAVAWLAEGRPLYVAGPTIANWETGLLARYQVIPWGRLVRLTPSSENPQSILPDLTQAQDETFGGRLHLSGVDFAPSVETGEILYAFFTWDALANLPDDVQYSLRLTQGDDIVVQKDDTLLSGWFPLDYIPAGQAIVGAYPLQVPLGIIPGRYRLQLVVYEGEAEWPLGNGGSVLDLGPIDVTFTPAATAPGWVRFNGEIALDKVNFGVSRVKQGKGFEVVLLWQALKSPPDNYTLLLELVDQEDRVWRDWRQPTATATWQKGQQVKQQVDITIPAEAPTGEDALTVRASWLRPDGRYLQAQRWIIPFGRSIDLGAPRILPKPDRVWERPAMQAAVEVNFEDKVALIGVDLPDTVTISGAPAVLPLTLYWQGRGEMDQVYYAFVHLLDADGNLVTQKDGVQAQGKEPTTSWAVGEYIADPVEIPLPVDLPPGTYSVVTGLYLPPHGPRLLRLNAKGEVIGDSVQVGMVDIERTE